MLHVEETGAGPRLILAHGFSQNRRCWGPFLDDLARDHTVAAVDLPGHGATPPAHDQADLHAAGGLLVAGGHTGVYVGYSLGGRVALHGALAQPDRMLGLVLIGATAGIDDERERTARRAADEVLAAQLEGGDLGGFIDRWLAQPLFAGLTPETACRSERLTNRADGLAASLRCCGTGTQAPLWEQLGELTMPVLVIAGDRDAKFTALGRRLVDALPNATLELVGGTHAVHLEAPAAVAELIRRAGSPPA